MGTKPLLPENPAVGAVPKLFGVADGAAVCPIVTTVFPAKVFALIEKKFNYYE